MEQSSRQPHVLIFPFPLHGPVNSMLKLAELLCLSNLHVTFLVTDNIHTRLLRYSDVPSRFHCYPGFRIEKISDGLPEEHPRGGDRYTELFDSLNVNTKPLFEELLTSGRLGNDKIQPPVTCIITDGSMGFTCDVANEIGIPIIYSRTISTCCLWVFFCLPKLIEAGDLPFQGNDLDTPIKSVPGMEDYLRCRDLPSFCRSGNLSDPSFQLFKREGVENARAYGLILNTFEELEGPILSQIRTVCPNIYPIGPLHAHLKTKLSGEKKSSSNSSSNIMWEEDKSCITWLNSQAPKSVIYVSFGSIAVMTKDQLLEFWHGLLNSGSKFLWVIRSNLVARKDWKTQIPAELLERTKERGYIVGWAPQEEVLAHPAVGGFLTHNGWNSTLESVIEGVPMICWPYFLDQQVNSRFVGEVWKLGLDMKDTCDRVVIEKMVKELMVQRREEFLRSADKMAKLGKKSLKEGGSSNSNMNRLIQDIIRLAAQSKNT